MTIEGQSPDEFGSGDTPKTPAEPTAAEIAAEATPPEDQVRVLRILEYVGNRQWVEDVVSRSITGKKWIPGQGYIQAATLHQFPERLGPEWPRSRSLEHASPKTHTLRTYPSEQLTINNEEITEELSHVVAALEQAAPYHLEAEIVTWALMWARKHPDKSITELITWGFDEWVK